MSEETVKTSEEKPIEHKHHEGLAGKVFWGLLLVLIGGLLLASNFGFVNVDWANIWRLWPLFIVFAGLSVLSFKHIVWKIVSVLLSIATIAAIAWVAIGGFDQLRFGDNLSTQEYTATVQSESNEVKSAAISIDSGASDMNITTVVQSAIVDANLDSNFATLTHSSERVGSVQNINLSMESSGVWLGAFKNDWEVKLTRDLPISLDLDTGASNVDIDLTEAKTSSVNVDMGASDLSLIMGDKQTLAKIEINSGASSINIRIPSSVGVKLNIDDGLTSKNLADLTEVSDGVYQSANYAGATKIIEIIANIGVSSFTIERY